MRTAEDLAISSSKHRGSAGIWTSIVLVALLLAHTGIAAGQIAVPSPGTRPAAKGSSACIRIATWNVRDCSATDRKTGSIILLHSMIARALRDAQVDIVALQEIQVEGRKGADIVALQRELEEVRWPMPYVAWAKSPQNDDQAVFSRFPIIAWSSELNPSGAPWPRPVLHVRISFDTVILELYAAHFKAFHDEKSLEARKSQARALASLVRSRHGPGLSCSTVVLAGDFNTIIPEDLEPRIGTLALLMLKDDSDSSNDFESVNLKWRYLEPTYLSRQYASMTDHIILSPRLAASVESSSITLIEPPDSGLGFPVSDHRLVVLCLSRSVLR